MYPMSFLSYFYFFIFFLWRNKHISHDTFSIIARARAHTYIYRTLKSKTHFSVLKWEEKKKTHIFLVNSMNESQTHFKALLTQKTSFLPQTTQTHFSVPTLFWAFFHRQLKPISVSQLSTILFFFFFLKKQTTVFNPKTLLIIIPQKQNPFHPSLEIYPKKKRRRKKPFS